VFGQASCVLQRSKMEVKRSELFTSPNICETYGENVIATLDVYKLV